LVAISREPCMGRCPVYSAVITRAGKGYYNGIKNVSRLGIWRSTLEKSQLTEIERLIRSSGVFQSDTAYVNPFLADFPGFSVKFDTKRGLRKISVMDASPPAEVAGFAHSIDSLLETLDWNRVVDPSKEKD